MFCHYEFRWNLLPFMKNSRGLDSAREYLNFRKLEFWVERVSDFSFLCLLYDLIGRDMCKDVCQGVIDYWKDGSYQNVYCSKRVINTINSLTYSC